MRIFTILQIVFIIGLFSCNTQSKEECIHDNFLHEFSKGDFEADIPPVNMNYLFFVELTNDSIIDTSNLYLYQIYKQHYLEEFSNFHMFLCSLYNNDLFLERDFLNAEILRNGFMFKKGDTFENMDLSELKERYLDDLCFLEVDVDLSYERKFNLMYLFFRNEYYITHSDLTGLFSIRKHGDNESN